ncbi:chemotaxis protein CheA [uncultured Tateyamaria sp.]|uniref:chemotaxis protein CheA n=1 Tax=uncultured Tateyamaria sp. TaxID=455651 RepID=UPI002632B821|nr:chemotaxis protein CheA [uncultured Tateyamaria sp.]
MTAPDPMAEIRASFFVECEELLEALQDGLHALEEGSHDDDTIHVVFRAVHSIKGGAGAFGLAPLVQFSHRYETVLDAVRTDTLVVTSDVLKLFFRAADHLSDIVRASRDGASIAEGSSEGLLADLDALVDRDETGDQDDAIAFAPIALDLDLNALAEAPCTATFDISFTPEPDLFDTGNDVPHILSVLAEIGTLETICDTGRLPALDQLAPEAVYLSWSLALTTDVDVAEIESVFEFVEGLCELTISKRDVVPADMPVAMPETTIETQGRAPDETPPPKQTAPAPNKSVVRVDIDRIERLVNLVGELVINQAMLAQSLQGAGLSPHSDAMNGLEEFQRLTRDIQDSVMMIRAQPVKSLFQRMSRIVREASASVSKNVRLVTVGETTEVDKTVIERLADPLTHMIRNAVDHGLETTDMRVAQGKPAQGQVRLSAAHRSGRVVLEISDDGAGIDRPRVFQIAVEKGLVPADASLTDTEIDNLLFMPGFSTASTVSDLSGRGVGMDVVRTAIQELGGRISISSEPGKGTSFNISLPLTLAVLDGMVVDVAGETLVLPLNFVTETLTLTDATVETIRPGSTIVRNRDGFVPLFDLGGALGYRPEVEDFVDRIALLLTLEDDTRVALIVDEIQDQRQVVIKGLDDSFYRAPGIAAATILGDGQIALILDPADVVSNITKSRVHALSRQKMEA